MPLYEYECIECQNIREEYRSIVGRNDAVWCPECGALTRLQISVPSHHVMDPAVSVKRPYNL